MSVGAAMTAFDRITVALERIADAVERQADNDPIAALNAALVQGAPPALPSDQTEPPADWFLGAKAQIVVRNPDGTERAATAAESAAIKARVKHPSGRAR